MKYDKSQKMARKAAKAARKRHVHKVLLREGVPFDGYQHGTELRLPGDVWLYPQTGTWYQYEAGKRVVEGKGIQSALEFIGHEGYSSFRHPCVDYREL